jgi:hypothetical protein
MKKDLSVRAMLVSVGLLVLAWHLSGGAKVPASQFYCCQPPPSA